MSLIAARGGRQVLLRWNIQRGVPVIPRSNTPANIRANAEGLFDWRLSEAQKVQPLALPGRGNRGVPSGDSHRGMHARLSLPGAQFVVRSAGVLMRCCQE